MTRSQGQGPALGSSPQTPAVPPSGAERLDHRGCFAVSQGRSPCHSVLGPQVSVDRLVVVRVVGGGGLSH